jgi:hypothetical protein
MAEGSRPVDRQVVADGVVAALAVNEEGDVRVLTSLFFAVVTVLLGGIRAGVGGGNDALPAIAGLVFLVAGAAFAFLDWPNALRRESSGLP